MVMANNRDIKIIYLRRLIDLIRKKHKRPADIAEMAELRRKLNFIDLTPMRAKTLFSRDWLLTHPDGREEIIRR